MFSRDEISIQVPDDEKGPSWVAIAVLFLISGGVWPLGAVGLFLLIKKLVAMSHNAKYKNYRQYAVIIGARPYVRLSELARTTGKTEGIVREELQAMIDKGFMGSRAYIDKSTGCVVIDPDRRPGSAQRSGGARQGDEDRYVREERVIREEWTGSGSSLNTAMDESARQAAYNTTVSSGPKSQPAQARPVERSAQGEKPARPASAKPVENEFEATLRKIKELNERIDDAPMSDKIDRIGEITASIFQVVQQRPDRREEVNKFMSYYLPTTMKLLESYSLLEKQTYQGENIAAARKDIEKIIATMVPAFEKQLDRLFQADAMDISTDIDVLEAMMAKDGLSDAPKLSIPHRR